MKTTSTQSDLTIAPLVGGALLAFAALAGCATVRDHRGYVVDRTMAETIAPGVDNQASVTAAMGQPTFVSQFGQPTWFYVAEDTHQPAFRGPKVDKATVIRVRFDAQNRVASVDTADATRMLAIRPDGHATPTLGRHRSLLEDLFSNIGTVGTGGGNSEGGGGGGGGGGSGPNGGGPNGS